MATEYGYKEFDAPPVRSLRARLIDSLGPATSNSINRGLAAMPTQERSIKIDGRAGGGDQPQRRHREAMARNISPQGNQPQGSNPRAEAEISRWDDEPGWDHDQDEAAGPRARKLLSRSNSGFHRISDNFSALTRWVSGERWVKRLTVVIGVLAVIFAVCF